MTKSNREMAVSMGGNVLDEVPIPIGTISAYGETYAISAPPEATSAQVARSIAATIPGATANGSTVTLPHAPLVGSSQDAPLVRLSGTADDLRNLSACLRKASDGGKAAVKIGGVTYRVRRMDRYLGLRSALDAFHIVGTAADLTSLACALGHAADNGSAAFLPDNGCAVSIAREDRETPRQAEERIVRSVLAERGHPGRTNRAVDGGTVTIKVTERSPELRAHVDHHALGGGGSGMFAPINDAVARYLDIVFGAEEAKLPAPLVGGVTTIANHPMLSSETISRGVWDTPLAGAGGGWDITTNTVGGSSLPPQPDPAPGQVWAPPVEIDVPLAFTEEARRALLTHLNAMHGYPNGVPFDETPPSALVDATYNLMTVRRLRLVVTHLSADGTPTFEIARNQG